MAGCEFTSVVVSISKVFVHDMMGKLVSFLDISLALILNLLFVMVFFLESASQILLELHLFSDVTLVWLQV